MPDFLHADKENFSDEELMQEEKIRPQSFADFAGQRKTLDNLEVFVAAAKNRGGALDHVLLHGPPGLGKTTLAHIIANELGVTQGALFRHFPNKESIWLAAIDWVENELLGRLELAANQAADPMDGLRRVFLAHVGFVVALPGVPRLIFNELQQPADSTIKAAVRKLLERYRQLIHRLMDAAIDGGEIDRGINVSAAATLFIGSIQGLVMQSMLADNVQTMPASAEQVFPLFLRSLKAMP